MNMCEHGGVPTHNLTPQNSTLERIAVNQLFVSKQRQYFDCDLS